jgi:prepilin-type N-terminal cleavage/methylation domain-containing protein
MNNINQTRNGPDQMGGHCLKSNCSAFTLVEIMIVVAIIGMLAAIAVPSYGRARERAHRTACIANLRQIDGAVQLWAMENKKDTGAPVTYAEIRPFLKHEVSCPAGGTTFDDSYTLPGVDQSPTCKRQPGHKLD